MKTILNELVLIKDVEIWDSYSVLET